MTTLDEEIRATEHRIAREREELARMVDDCAEQARERISSPSALALAVGAGCVLGRALRGSRTGNATAPAKATSIAGLLTGAVWSMVRARYGSPMAIAQMILATRRRKHRYTSPLDHHRVWGPTPPPHGFERSRPRTPEPLRQPREP